MRSHARIVITLTPGVAACPPRHALPAPPYCVCYAPQSTNFSVNRIELQPALPLWRVPGASRRVARSTPVQRFLLHDGLNNQDIDLVFAPFFTRPAGSPGPSCRAACKIS